MQITLPTKEVLLRRHLSCLSVLILGLSVVILPPREVKAVPFIRGDVDANGSLEMADALRIFGFLFLGTPRFLACTDAADANDSSVVDLSDGIYILAYLFVGAPSPTAPFPTCGTDPSDDILDCRSDPYCPVPFCEKVLLESSKVDVGGHTLWFRATGQGCPGIVVEAGFGDTGSGSWNSFMYEVAALSRTLVYDRAGLGLSTELGPAPRSSFQIATELHALLQITDFEPPYVLVGHSKGGYDIRTFASLFPDEVAGMVFVDPAHECCFSKFKELYPAEFDRVIQAADLATAPRAIQLEAEPWLVAWTTAPGPIPDVPMVVLTGLNGPWASLFSNDFNEIVTQLWDESHEKLSRSVTNGSHMSLVGVGHDIHLERPQAVLDAIQQVVDAVR